MARGAAYREGLEGRFATLPVRPGEGPVGGRHGGFAAPGGDPGDRFFHGFEGGRGHGRGHGHGGFGGPGEPPHGGRPPFGRPPRPLPDGEALQERIESASLAELVALAGRLMHHRPGARAARGQNLILSILAGREALSRGEAPSQGETLSQRELQQMLGVRPGSVSEIISKLERKGLVVREKGEDRRGNLLRITEAGRQAIPRGGEAAEDELFSALDAAQREALASLLRTLLSDWASRLGGAECPPEPEGAFRTLEERAPEGGRGVKL